MALTVSNRGCQALPALQRNGRAAYRMQCKGSMQLTWQHLADSATGCCGSACTTQRAVSGQTNNLHCPTVHLSHMQGAHAAQCAVLQAFCRLCRGRLCLKQYMVLLGQDADSQCCKFLQTLGSGQSTTMPSLHTGSSDALAGNLATAKQGPPQASWFSCHVKNGFKSGTVSIISLSRHITWT